MSRAVDILRPWLAPIFRCLRAPSRTARALISPLARGSLHKCRIALEAAESHFLPFAAIESFPHWNESLIVTYADAAGDGEYEGMGFWFVLGDSCFLFCAKWLVGEKRVLIHAREAFISTCALISTHLHAPSRLFVLEYTDNTPTEFVHDSQASRCPLLQHIIEARGDFLDASGLCVLPQRVKSKDNRWADMLSRGHWKAVLAEVVRRGLRPVWVDMPRDAQVLRASLASLANVV